MFSLSCAIAVSLVGLAFARDSSFLTPGGYRDPACVFHVPSGSTIHEDGKITLPNNDIKYHRGCTRRHEPVTPSSNTSTFKGGWQVYTKQNVGNGVQAMLGTFNVPDAPKKYTGQTIFLFPGLQNIDWVPPESGPNSKFDIIQPVLQYGPSAAGGGQYWAISSWYVPLGGFFDSSSFSDLLTVKPGQTIYGSMKKTGASSWTIETVVVETNQTTTLNIDKDRLVEQPWAYVTLEAYADYDQLTCDEYPTQPVEFTGLTLQVNGSTVPFKWQPITATEFCKPSVQVKSATNVTIGW